MDHPAAIMALDGHRLPGADEAGAIALPPEIDQRTPAAIGQHEHRAIGFGNAAAHADHAAIVGQRADRHRLERRHLDRGAGHLCDRRAAADAEREQRGTHDRGADGQLAARAVVRHGIVRGLGAFDLVGHHCTPAWLMPAFYGSVPTPR